MDADDARPRYFSRFLQGTFNHYSAGIPERLPWLFRVLVGRFFAHVEVSEKSRAKLERLAREGVLVYALPNPSRLEYLLLTYRLRMLGLPAPTFGHYLSVYMVQPLAETLRRAVAVAVSLLTRRRYPSPYRDGLVREQVQAGRPCAVFLRQFRGVPRRFTREHVDPLAALVQTANELDRRLLLVPVLILYSKEPIREAATLLDLFLGPRTQPGRLRRLYTLLRNYRRTVLRLGKTIDVDRFVEDLSARVAYSTDRMEQIAYALRTEALARIEAEQRVAVGPARKYRSEIIEAALQDAETRRGIHEYAAETGLSYSQGRRLVRDYLEEIAADMDGLAIGLLERLITWFLRRNYSGLVVDDEGLHRVRKVARHTPLVYVPCHKSHMDYLLVSYILYSRHMSLPYIAAGINLSFWPVGPIFRRAGAFFLRRSFKGAPLYPLAFAKYVEVILREGYNLEFFIEGGRSRTGKLGVPKLGFLSIVLDAARKARLPDLAFVPVMITYERVLEDAYYFREQSGDPNPPENLVSMLKGRGVLGRRQGKVYVQIGEIISLTDFLARRGHPSIPADRKGTMELAGDLAHRLVAEMNRIAMATPYGVVAAAVLSTEKRGIYMEDIRRRVDILVGYLRERGVPFTEHVGGRDFWPDPLLAVMESEGSVRADHGERGDPVLYFVDEERRLSLTFYKNSVVHHFQTPAMLAAAMLRQGAADEETLRSDYRVLRRILRREFLLDPDAVAAPDPLATGFDEALAYLERAGHVERIDGRLVRTASGREALQLFASLIAAFLESYFIAFSAAARIDGAAPEREIHRLALKRAERLYSTGEIRRKESKNRLLFDSALGILEDLGAVRVEVRPIGRGKRYERTYEIIDKDRVIELQAELQPFVDALS